MNFSSLRCLGVDPGSKHLGYGLVEQQFNRWVCLDGGCLNLPQRDPFLTRLTQIVHWMDGYLEEKKPDCLILESAFVGRFPTASIKLGQVRGAIMALALRRSLPLFEYAPRQIKQSLTGQGGAQKLQVNFMVQKILNLKQIDSLDQTDALAVALTHLFRIKADLQTSRMRGVFSSF